MFRLQNNTPPVYCEQSRDFQLFCRLYDSIFNGVKYDIDSIPNILDPMKINDRLLTLLCTKVGFFTKRTYDSNILRHILVAFPYALKYKGSKKGIDIAVSTILKAEGDTRITGEASDVFIEYDKNQPLISIYTTVPIINKHALSDFLSYIMPVGYMYVLERYVKLQKDHVLLTNDNYTGMVNPSISNSQIRGTDRVMNTAEDNNQFNFRTSLENKYIGSIGASEIIGSDNMLTNKEYATDRNSTNRDTIDSSIAKRDGVSQVTILNAQTNIQEEDNE